MGNKNARVKKKPSQYENLNFATFTANQILMRMGWVFKTESVIVPAYLDTLSKSDVLRGLLPVSFRLVQSLAQFFLAQRVSQTPFKQPLYTTSIFGMMLSWLVIAIVAGVARLPSSFMVVLFLAVYTLQCFFFGYHRLAAGTLQGKLIPPEKRGSLLAHGNSVGSILAIAVACRFMYEWLGEETPRYAAVFGGSAVCYGVGAIVTFYFVESPSPPQKLQPPLQSLREGLQILRSDRDFRKFAVVAVLYFSSWPLFPHYTVFGKRVLGMESSHFVVWIIVTNLVAALGFWLIGGIADRRGNRLVLRILLFLSACTPLAAVGISRLSYGAKLYWIIYALLGMIPVIVRIVENYTLELSTEKKHPQYLSVVSLLEACSLLVSPLVGLLISKVSFEPVFLGGGVLIATACLLTFWLVEPRNNGAR